MADRKTGDVVPTPLHTCASRWANGPLQVDATGTGDGEPLTHESWRWLGTLSSVFSVT